MNKDKKNNKKSVFSTWNFVFLFVMFFVILQFFTPGKIAPEIKYSQFKDSLRANRIESVIISEKKIIGTFKPIKDTNDVKAQVKKKGIKDLLKFQGAENRITKEFTTVKIQDENLVNELESHDVEFSGEIDSNWFTNLIGWIFPVVFIFLLWGYLFRRMSSGSLKGGGTGNIFNIGKSKAKLYVVDEKHKVSFEDVAGVDEAKEELNEMIEFLKTPQKFTRLGAKLPKGVLLVGPPGTGKTLLAKAVAGEAQVPFFSLTGSDFVEMFVGVGAARVRDLFMEAKSKQPCIIFIDEIDAVGKSRGQVVQLNTNDERENTLNQLLSEMDGFQAGDSIILIGSTNRPEVLDRALLRPGRFDRQILVDRPDLKGRIEILKVHTRNIKLAGKDELNKTALQTPGFSGADLANICNEAALLASRKGKQEVEFDDFQEAIERVIAGLEKKNRLINPKERKIVAYHESGHAIVGYFTPGADPIQKVSIVPRGIGALGYTMQTPLEDRFLMSKNELLGKIKGMLGGRAAEEIIFNDISTGAANDLERVTQIAYDMVTIYGMSPRIPNISLKRQNQNQFFGQDFMVNKRSESIEKKIDEDAIHIIDSCYNDAKVLLYNHIDKLNIMAKKLLEKEVLNEEDVKNILGNGNNK